MIRRGIRNLSTDIASEKAQRNNVKTDLRTCQVNGRMPSEDEYRSTCNVLLNIDGNYDVLTASIDRDEFAQCVEMGSPLFLMYPLKDECNPVLSWTVQGCANDPERVRNRLEFMGFCERLARPLPSTSLDMAARKQNAAGILVVVNTTGEHLLSRQFLHDDHQYDHYTRGEKFYLQVEFSEYEQRLRAFIGPSKTPYTELQKHYVGEVVGETDTHVALRLK